MMVMVMVMVMEDDGDDGDEGNDARGLKTWDLKGRMHFSDVHGFGPWDCGVGHVEMNITPTCKGIAS